jgi:hypothetical protein
MGAPADVRRDRVEPEGQVTRRDQFLAEMNARDPVESQLLVLIEPYYPKAAAIFDAVHLISCMRRPAEEVPA